MAKPRTPAGRLVENEAARALLDELRPRAGTVDPEFSFNSAYMEFQLDMATVTHALARAGALADARAALARVKKSSQRGPLRAIALAQAERGEAEAARQTARELPPTGKPSARSTLIELVEVQARCGDFDGAAQAAEELEDAEESARTLANV